MTIKNLIIDGQVHTLFSEIKTMPKLHCQRLNCLLPRIMKLFEEIFCMQAELFKTQINLMSLSFYSKDHRRIPLPHPLPFESVFLGVCSFETRLWQNSAWESVTMVLDLWA